MSALPASASRGAAARDDVRVADLDRRFYAFAVDRLIAWGVDVAVASVAVELLVERGHALLGVLLVAATLLVVGGVFALVEGTTGSSPGKALLGLRTVHAGTGEPIGVGAAGLRTFVLGASAVPFGLGLAALAWTAVADPARMRRGWHDRLVSSIVVDTRPSPVVEQVAEDDAPRHVVNLTAMRLVRVGETREAPELASVPPRAPSRSRRTRRSGDKASERTTERDRSLAAERVPEPTVPGTLPPATWGLVFDSGERVVVDRLVLVGRGPEPRAGEEAARLVALPSADRSVSTTHVQVVVAADQALVVTDRGSTSGSTLVRQGMPRSLTAGRPTTLLEGDVVRLGDRTMTVVRIE
jgi:uncharacterized RDD family membrane protein YckC